MTFSTPDLNYATWVSYYAEMSNPPTTMQTIKRKEVKMYHFECTDTEARAYLKDMPSNIRQFLTRRHKIKQL